MSGAGKSLGVLAQHLFDRSDSSRQAEALEGTVHILPGRFDTREKRKAACCGNLHHGVALLCGFDTPSLTAQGGQRLPPYSNIHRDIPFFHNIDDLTTASDGSFVSTCENSCCFCELILYQGQRLGLKNVSGGEQYTILVIDVPLECGFQRKRAVTGMRRMPVISSHISLPPSRLAAASPPPDTVELPKNGVAVWPDDLSREVFGVLGFPLDVVDMATVLRRIRNADDNAAHFLISTTNLNYVVISRRDAEFRNSLLFSDLCTADGMPIVWIPRLLGVPISERIAGSDIIDALKAAQNSSRRLKVFLFGGPEGVSDAACRHINASADSMTCVGSYYPGYATIDELSDESIIDMINSSGADLLIACLGARKGQAWLQRNHDRLQIPVRVHLGAAVKYEAGTIKRAPLLMQRSGLEWLWRIKEEPALWSRYLKDGMVLLRLLFTRIMPLVILAHWQRLIHANRELAIKCNEHDKVVTLSLSGAATTHYVSNAIPHFQEALGKGKPVVINFTDTDRIDARFLGLLLMLNKQLKKHQLPMTFEGVPSRVERILRLNDFGFLLGA